MIAALLSAAALASSASSSAESLPPLAIPPVPRAASAAKDALPNTIVNPEWERLPMDLEPYFPRHAAQNNVSGRTVMRCKATAVGLLSECVILSEDPIDEGFGSSALASAPLFKLKPTTKDGRPVEGGFVTIPMKWLMPDQQGAAPPAGGAPSP